MFSYSSRCPQDFYLICVALQKQYVKCNRHCQRMMYMYSRIHPLFSNLPKGWTFIYSHYYFTMKLLSIEKLSRIYILYFCFFKSASAKFSMTFALNSVLSVLSVYLTYMAGSDSQTCSIVFQMFGFTPFCLSFASETTLLFGFILCSNITGNKKRFNTLWFRILL